MTDGARAKSGIAPWAEVFRDGEALAGQVFALEVLQRPVTFERAAGVTTMLMLGPGANPVSNDSRNVFLGESAPILGPDGLERWALSCSVSCVTLGVPVTDSRQPSAKAEFAQPWSGAPVLPQGQGVPRPSPKQSGVPTFDDLTLPLVDKYRLEIDRADAPQGRVMELAT